MKLSPEERMTFVEKYLRNEVSMAQAADAAGVAWQTMNSWVRIYENEGPTGLIETQKNRHYPKELKLAAVTDYLTGNGSINDMTKKYHLRSSTQLKNWIKIYNTHGNFKSESGGSYMRKARDTELDERLEIVLDCLNNDKNYGAMAKKYNVSYQQVRNWVKKYEEMGQAGLEDRRGHRAGTQPSRTPEEEMQYKLTESERRIKELEMENDLLKKVRELERKWPLTFATEPFIL